MRVVRRVHVVANAIDADIVMFARLFDAVVGVIGIPKHMYKPIHIN